MIVKLISNYQIRKERLFDKIKNKILHLNKRNSTNNCFLQDKLEEDIYALLRKKIDNESDKEKKSNKNLNNVDATKSAIVSNSYLII